MTDTIGRLMIHNIRKATGMTWLRRYLARMADRQKKLERSKSKQVLGLGEDGYMKTQRVNIKNVTDPFGTLARVEAGGMKRHRYATGWVAAACGVALSGLLPAWGQAESTSAPIPAADFCGAKTIMTSAEQLRELPPANTSEELLQLLRTLHDNFLLLDPGFIEDTNLLRLFGPGEVQPRKPINKWDKATRKDFAFFRMTL